MSRLEFSRSHSKLLLITSGGIHIGAWDAANNVDSRSKGPWPDGEFEFEYHVSHPGDSPESPYGSHGVFIFNVPGREGMGVHSGRQDVPDGLGRRGYLHCTMGCIRTTDAAMAQLVRTHETDPLRIISVQQ